MNTLTWLFICNQYDESNTYETFDIWLESNYREAFKWYKQNS